MSGGAFDGEFCSNTCFLADLGWWRPTLLIVKLADKHASFQRFPAIVEHARRLRARQLAQGYARVYEDDINTIFRKSGSR